MGFGALTKVPTITPLPAPPKRLKDTASTLEGVVKWAGDLSNSLQKGLSAVRQAANQMEVDRLTVVGNRSYTLTYTDDGTYTSLTSVGSGGYLRLYGCGTPPSPYYAGSLNLGPTGTLAAWGATPIPNTAFFLNRGSVGSETLLVRVLDGNITSSSSGGLQGIYVNLTHSGASGATENIGTAVRYQSISNTGNTGIASVFKALLNMSGFTTGKTVASACLFKSVPEAFLLGAGALGGTLTALNQFWANTPTSMVFGTPSVLGTHRGFYCSDLKYGTNRVCFDAEPITSSVPAAPAIAFGGRSLLHTTGVLRRSWIGDNSIECTQNYVIVSTAGMGLVLRDTTDGNYYLINTTNGVLNAPVSLGVGPIAA